MQVDITSEFVLMQCGECGIYFYMPKVFQQECKNTKGKGWFCPNGHPRQYSETEVEKLGRELSEARQRLQVVLSERLEFKVGMENREKDLVKLRKRVKKLKAGA